MEEIKNMVMLEEKMHLNKVQKIIAEQLEEVNRALDNSKSQIIQQKQYLWENIYELDPEEIASNRESISEEHDSYEFRESKKRLLLKLQDNTYFGKIGFIYEGEDYAEEIYIGLGGLQSKNGRESIIFDWRAPISKLYYDGELGNTCYEAPMGKINGKIIQRRQLKVRKGILEYAINSGFKIDDEILQKELSSNSSTKMKNIVATIQKEQNSIVRDQFSPIMVVQGVAGSGKTSIALHRVAFLLYQNRKNLHSSDILIISPNSIFADYISNVLPELGEENISEVSFDEIAKHEMKGICKYESKYQQMEYIIGCTNESDDRLKRIRLKNSIIFLNELKNYVKHIEKTLLHFTSYDLNGVVFEKAMRNMAETTNVLSIYTEFIELLGKKYDELKNDRINESYLLYEDVFPVILLKLLLDGKKVPQFNRIKHVIVDEMQDYSLVQYEILNSYFKCKMTILGDINQVIDRNTDFLLDNIQNIFNQKVTLIKLLKTYRSTFEISKFCGKLCKLNGIEAVERHGKNPVLEECKDYNNMIEKIQSIMDMIDFSKITSVAVICKTSGAAEKLFYSLGDKYKEKSILMNKDNDVFQEGFIITNSLG